MKKYAQIDSQGIVVGISDFFAEASHPSLIPIADGLGVMGMKWNGLTFEAVEMVPTDAPMPVQQIVTAFQAKAALLHADLLDNVEAMMSNPATPRIVKLAWEEALHFERQSPTVAAMAAALGLTDAEVDALFTFAAEVQA